MQRVLARSEPGNENEERQPEYCKNVKKHALDLYGMQRNLLSFDFKEA